MLHGATSPRSQGNILAATSGGSGEWEPDTVASSQWSVVSESGGGGERRVVSCYSGEGECERSEPTQEKYLVLQNAPNEPAPSQNRANSAS
jgi:hypothetical protein